MSDLAVFLEKLSPNVLGEALRAITFVGEGVGCYQNFTVRADAIPWSPEHIQAFVGDDEDSDYIAQVAQGYSFQEGDLTIDVFWYWDGDGTLQFQVRQGEKFLRGVINTDCKKDYTWETVEKPGLHLSRF